MSLQVAESVEWTSSARRLIAKRYCRALAVIDDDIFDEHNERKLKASWDDLRKQCEHESILCHLHHFPTGHTNDGSDRESNAYGLARNADITVLDWNLGSPTPEHALNVLNNLSESPSLRVVLIYTNETDLGSVDATLLDRFPTLIRLRKEVGQKLPDEEESDDDGEATSDSHTESSTSEAHEVFNYQFENRLFIFVRSKEILSPENLIAEVHAVLLETFPDFLHWAALEMAVRTHELLPKVIASLPSGTDPALMLQLIYQRDEETAEQVAEVLLDEIRYALVQRPLEAVRDEEIFGKLRHVMNMYVSSEDKTAKVQPRLVETLRSGREKLKAQKQRKKEEDQVIELFAQFKAKWDASSLLELRDEAQRDNDDLATHFPYRGDSQREEVAKYLQIQNVGTPVEVPHVAWAGVREAVVLAAPKQFMQTGYVLQKSGGKEDRPEWLLCITPGCDCYRPTGHGYVFVAGRTKPTEPVRSRAAETQICVGQHEIIWDASHLVVDESISFPAGGTLNQETYRYDVHSAHYQLKGVVRDAFVMRIIQRVWSHQSRVAVDTAELLRKRRGE